jgi:phage tail tape-measure protein
MRYSTMLGRAGALALAATLAGCATWSEMDRSEKGTTIGAGGGALAGAAVGGPVGALVGAGVGAYVGHHQAPAIANANDARRDMRGNVVVGSERVRAAQQSLANRGYDPGTVEGVFGANTERALRDFQSSHGLTATGQLDPATEQALGVRRY